MKLYSSLSFKSKLLLFALCISLIPIVTITTIHYFNSRSALKGQILEKLTAVAESKRLHMQHLMEREKTRTIDLSTDEFIRSRFERITRKKGSTKSIVIRLNRYLSKNKLPLYEHLLAMIFVDKEGRVVSTTHEKFMGIDMSGRDVFKQGINKNYGKIYISQPHYDPYLDTNCILICAPIISQYSKETIGIIINAYSLAPLNEITKGRTGLGETGEIYLVNRDKIMITESRFTKDAPLRQVVDTKPVREIIEGSKSMVGVYRDYRGVMVAGMSIDIPEYGWILIGEEDKAEAFASLKRLSIIVLILGVVSAVVVISVGITFAVSTSVPIKDLMNTTERFAGGDLECRVKVTREDEIGNLARSFNTMAGKLASEIIGHKQVERELRILNDTLEQCVAERTEDLAKINKELRLEIAERKRAEEELKRYATQLKRSNEELQHFAYVASHDLQEPLRMISSYLQLIEKRYRSKLDADAEEFITYAVDGANRLQTMINGLLEYSRVDSRGKPFELVDCEAILERAFLNLEVAIKESNATITHDTLPTVTADSSQLLQVFQNLISNAMKFRGSEPPRIHISAKCKENEWVFSVHDNGIGIEPEYTKQLFNIFKRLHSREYPGVGLGLSICKKIINRHGGRIWLESEPGKGSTFYFTIPIQGEK